MLNAAHGLYGDPQGNIYLAEPSPSRVTRLVPYLPNSQAQETDMDELDLLITGGQVVAGGDVVFADIGVKNGKIAAIGQRLGVTAKQTVDATGMIVTPGGVDTHTHIDQPSPSAEMCDNFETASASAAAGGTTTVVSFAWQEVGDSLAEITRGYYEKARTSRVDYAFHLTITDPTEKVLEEELPALVAQGNRSIKIFMTYKGVGLDDGQILRVLDAARRNGALVCVHAEHHALIEYLTEKLLKAGLTTPKYFPWSKPIIAEREAVQRIIALSEALDVPIEIFHVSGAEPAAEIERAQKRGLKVWAETCPHYLTLTAADLRQARLRGRQVHLRAARPHPCRPGSALGLYSSRHHQRYLVGSLAVQV